MNSKNTNIEKLNIFDSKPKYIVTKYKCERAGIFNPYITFEEEKRILNTPQLRALTEEEIKRSKEIEKQKLFEASIYDPRVKREYESKNQSQLYQKIEIDDPRSLVCDGAKTKCTMCENPEEEFTAVQGDIPIHSDYFIKFHATHSNAYYIGKDKIGIESDIAAENFEPAPGLICKGLNGGKCRIKEAALKWGKLASVNIDNEKGILMSSELRCSYCPEAKLCFVQNGQDLEIELARAGFIADPNHKKLLIIASLLFFNAKAIQGTSVAIKAGGGIKAIFVNGFTASGGSAVGGIMAVENTGIVGASFSTAETITYVSENTIGYDLMKPIKNGIFGEELYNHFSNGYNNFDLYRTGINLIKENNKLKNQQEKLNKENENFKIEQERVNNEIVKQDKKNQAFYNSNTREDYNGNKDGYYNTAQKDNLKKIENLSKEMKELKAQNEIFINEKKAFYLDGAIYIKDISKFEDKIKKIPVDNVRFYAKKYYYETKENFFTRGKLY